MNADHTGTPVDTEPVSCVLCGPGETRLLFRVRDLFVGRPGLFPVVRCVCCGLAFISPRPRADSMAYFYPDRYYPLDEKPSPEALAVAEGLRQRVMAWASAGGVDNVSVLDVGCGTGLFLHLLQSRGYSVKGIELSRSAADYGHHNYGLSIHCGTLDDCQLRPGSFDVVTLWHVLEHLHDPLGALVRVRDLMVPGGLLLLGLPNFASVEARLFGRRWYSLDAPRHLYQFAPATLRPLLGKAGFAIERLVHSDGTAGFVYSLMGDLTGLSLKTRGRPLSPAVYAKTVGVLEKLIRPLCRAAAAAGRGGAIEVYARRLG